MSLLDIRDAGLKWRAWTQPSLRDELRFSELFLIVGKDVLQSAVVSFWFAAANEAHLFGFSGRGYVDPLRAYRRLFFTVVIIEDLILVTVDIETDLSQVNPSAKVVGIVKLLLCSLPAFWKLKLNFTGQAETILQITALFIKITRRAERDDFSRAFDRATKNNMFILSAE